MASWYACLVTCSDNHLGHHQFLHSGSVLTSVAYTQTNTNISASPFDTIIHDFTGSFSGRSLNQVMQLETEESILHYVDFHYSDRQDELSNHDSLVYKLKRWGTFQQWANCERVAQPRASLPRTIHLVREWHHHLVFDFSHLLVWLYSVLEFPLFGAMMGNSTVTTDFVWPELLGSDQDSISTSTTLELNNLFRFVLGPGIALIHLLLFINAKDCSYLTVRLVLMIWMITKMKVCFLPMNDHRR